MRLLKTLPMRLLPPPSSWLGLRGGSAWRWSSLRAGVLFVMHFFFFFALIENLVSLTSPQALSQKVDSRG